MKNYRARCLVCLWKSEWNQGPVFAGWDGMRHINEEHPDAEGFIIIIEKRGERREMFYVPQIIPR